MRKIYIAHPLIGDKKLSAPDFDANVMVTNRAKIDEICQRVAVENPDALILSPVHAFSFANPFERLYPLAKCRELLSIADELWVFGEWTKSEGCRMEVEEARRSGIPVRFFPAANGKILLDRETRVPNPSGLASDELKSKLLNNMRRILGAEGMKQWSDDMAAALSELRKTISENDGAEA